MMKKKIGAILVLLATTILIPQTSAQARSHHHRGAPHHRVHRPHTGSHVSHHATRHAYRHVRHRALRGYASQRSRYRLVRHHGVRLAHAGRIGGRPRAWCGWWLGQHLGMSNRSLWLARNWASVGSNAGRPGVGVVVVWRHHVGIITGHAGSQWVVKSGNDGHGVRERVRSISGAIAFRHVGGGSFGS
jgi:hypothetical protein